MGDRAGAWLKRAASPAALVSLLAVILLAVGAASALARRAPGALADVTLVTVAAVPPSTLEHAAAGPSPSPAAVEVTSTPLVLTPSPAPAGSPAPPSPSVSASPPPSTAPTVVATPAILGTPVTLPTSTPTPTASPPTAPIIQAPGFAGVGEAFALHVIAPGATHVSIDLDGATYTAAPVGDRFWVVIGIPVDAPPGPRAIRAVARAAAGSVLGSSVAPLQYRAVDRPVDYLELTAVQSSVLTEEAGRLEVQLRSIQFAQFDPTKRWAGRFLRPLFGVQTTTFGEGRSINGGPIGGFHTGMDIAADVGDPVRASAAGVVSWVGEMPIRGRSVIIDHGAGVKSGYHHLDLAYVSAGTFVEAGHVIGAAGSTGLSTGPHLHWEVTVWGVNVDPLQWTQASFEP